MFAKYPSVLAITALAIQTASAQQNPACLLGAIQTQPNVGDVKAICNNATNVEQSLSSMCGNNLQQAVSAFSSVCSSAGVTVSVTMTSNSTSATSTGSSTSSTGSGSAGKSGSGSSGGASASSGSGSSAATSIYDHTEVAISAAFAAAIGVFALVL